MKLSKFFRNILACILFVAGLPVLVVAGLLLLFIFLLSNFLDEVE